MADLSKAVTVDRALPYEYATRAIPDALELCVRCKGGLVHRRGPTALPYCPRCGFEGDDVRYVRADSSSSAGTPP